MHNFMMLKMNTVLVTVTQPLRNANTPCPEKNGTNNVLGITLANTNI